MSKKFFTVLLAFCLTGIAVRPSIAINPEERFLPLRDRDNMQRILRVSAPTVRAHGTADSKSPVISVLNLDELYVSDRNEWGWYRLKTDKGFIWCYGKFLVELVPPCTIMDTGVQVSSTPPTANDTSAIIADSTTRADFANPITTAEASHDSWITTMRPDTIFAEPVRQHPLMDRIPSLLASIATSQMKFWPGVALQAGVEFLRMTSRDNDTNSIRNYRRRAKTFKTH